VQPGDLVIGDYDGVTVIPRDMVETVLENAEKKDAYENKRRETIKKYEECRLAGRSCAACAGLGARHAQGA
jgi:regulator of RNase E activity RraA